MKPFKLILQFVLAFVALYITFAISTDAGLTMAFVVPLVGLDEKEFCNPSGVNRVFYGFKDDFSALPSFPAVPADVEDISTLTGVFTPLTDKGLYPIYGAEKMSEIKYEQLGNDDNPYYQATIELHYPWNSAEAHGLMAALKCNRKLFFLVEEIATPLEFAVLGFEKRCVVKSNGTSGKAYDDQKGITITVTATAFRTPIAHYSFANEGAIPLA